MRNAAYFFIKLQDWHHPQTKPQKIFLKVFESGTVTTTLFTKISTSSVDIFTNSFVLQVLTNPIKTVTLSIKKSSSEAATNLSTRFFVNIFESNRYLNIKCSMFSGSCTLQILQFLLAKNWILCLLKFRQQ